MVQSDCRMVFHTDSFFYFQFWDAAWNALIFWELLRFHNRGVGPHRVTMSHWVVKFIIIMPMTGHWAKVT